MKSVFIFLCDVKNDRAKIKLKEVWGIFDIFQLKYI